MKEVAVAASFLENFMVMISEEYIARIEAEPRKCKSLLRNAERCAIKMANVLQELQQTCPGNEDIQMAFNSASYEIHSYVDCLERHCDEST